MEIEFHILVSEGFKIEADDVVCIRFDDHRLGSWVEDCVTMQGVRYALFAPHSPFSSPHPLFDGISRWQDPISYLSGTLVLPESMVLDRHIIYKYRVRRANESPHESPDATFEALEHAEQNRSLNIKRTTYNRLSVPTASGRRKILQFDDIIYPQQSNSMFTRLKSTVYQAFRPSSATVVGDTYAMNLLPALRFKPIGVVCWVLCSLLNSFRDRHLVSAPNSPIKPKSGGNYEEFVTAVFNCTRKYAESGDVQLKATIVYLMIYRETYRQASEDLVSLLPSLLTPSQFHGVYEELLQQIQQVCPPSL